MILPFLSYLPSKKITKDMKIHKANKKIKNRRLNELQKASRKANRRK